MRRALVLAAVGLVGCPDLSDLTSNLDAAVDAPLADASADVVVQDVAAQDVAQNDCGAARRVQAVHVNNSDSSPDASVTTMSLLLPLAQTAGDFIVTTINYDNPTCGAPTVSDSRGNTYVKLVARDGLSGAGDLETWGAENVNTADLGQNTVTVTFANACTGRAMKVVHYTGIATSAAVESTSTEHGDGATSSNLLTVTAPALLFAHSADQGHALEAGVGWSLVMIDDWATIAQERDALITGTYPVDYVHNQENWVIQAIALRRCQ